MWRAITTVAAPTWPRSTARRLALADYRDVPALEEALFIIVKSYDALGMTQLRDDARRVLETNLSEQSEYLSRGFKASQDPWWKFW